MTKFKKEVLDKMLTDADLFAEVSKVKGIKPANLGTVIRRNGPSINQYAVVKLVSDYLGCDPDSLLEPTKLEPVAA